jgi:NitT/TauT family transport system permease protein
MRRTRLDVIGPPLLTAILVIGLWQLATDIFAIKPYVLPSPVEIFEVYVHHFSLIWHNAKYTLWEAVLGFAIGCVAAWLFGMAMAASRSLERSFLPFVVGSTTIPIVAVAPILILILGIGIASKVAVTAFLCFFPMCINTLKGMRSSPAAAIELMHVQAASRREELTKVRIPASLPYVFVGLRLAAAASVIGAIIGEFVGAEHGLGYLIVQASYQLDAPMMWASMFASAVLGIFMFVVVVVAERKIVHWHDAVTR